MKAFVLVTSLHAAVPAGGASLGVGLDVLPVAYTFAANRLGFDPDLRLTSCDKTSCRWSIGHGVDLVAFVSEWGLGVKQLEVDASNPASSGADGKHRFDQACSTIVALTMVGAAPSEVQAIARSLSGRSPESPAERREWDEGNIRFYVTLAAPGSSESVRGALRCGAALRTQ